MNDTYFTLTDKLESAKGFPVIIVSLNEDSPSDSTPPNVHDELQKLGLNTGEVFSSVLQLTLGDYNTALELSDEEWKANWKAMKADKRLDIAVLQAKLEAHPNFIASEKFTSVVNDCFSDLFIQEDDDEEDDW